MSEKKEGKNSNGGSDKRGEFRWRDLPQVPRLNQYSSLNALKVEILEEPLSVDLIPLQRRRVSPLRSDAKKHYLHHKNMGHIMEDCITLHDKIEELISVGHLKKEKRREHSYHSFGT